MSEFFSESIFGQRMYECYPQVISCIEDFRAILKAEYPEIEDINTTKDMVMANSYLSTMTVDRIADWERVLKITPPTDATIEDRRDVIIARVRGQGKLNTTIINAIVNTFTGGKANSWVENSTLYVEITPPPNNKQYRFESIEQELQNKVPAHLDLVVTRNYYEWDEVSKSCATWQDVLDKFTIWENVYLYIAE